MFVSKIKLYWTGDLAYLISDIEFKISVMKDLVCVGWGGGGSTYILLWLLHTAETLVSHTLITPRDEL